MSPFIHGLLAWFVALALVKDITGRRLIVIAGVAADIDGVFILFNQDYYFLYHHTFGHSYIFGILIAITAAGLANERIKVGIAAFIAFSLHLLADIFGTTWAVFPFYPISDIGFSIGWYTSGVWISNVINFLVAIISFILVYVIMYFKEISPLEFFSQKLDRWFVGMNVYWLKYKCIYCGKIAIRECDRCKHKVCFDHVERYFGLRCSRCAGINNTP